MPTKEKLSAAAQVIIHQDKTATYWSVYDQQWRHRRPITAISDQDLASMHPQERERVLAKLNGGD